MSALNPPLLRGLSSVTLVIRRMENELLRGTVQHDEVSDFPSKGRLSTSLSPSLVGFLTLVSGRSSVRLPAVPGDDHRKLRCLSREPVETSLSSMADDDAKGASRWLEGAQFLCGFRVFARHNRFIGSDPLLLCTPPDWPPS